MNDKLIEFKEVTKRFGKNTVLNSINFAIPEGKVTGIIGASGEGKSTILKMIASFYKPTSGKIFYFNRDILKDVKNIKTSFGIAIEDGSFYENLTVEENLLYFGKLYHVKRKVLIPRVNGLMHFVGLIDAKDILSKNLSMGMKKRLDIACSLVHKPSVLILDEPTADLDPLLRFQIMKIIKKINSHGTTVILTTQLLNEAEDICDKIAILFNEKIQEHGTPEEIKKKYHVKNLDDAFRKIFSKKSRKTYQESSNKKTKFKDYKEDKKAKEFLKKYEKYGSENSQDEVTKKELEEVFSKKKKEVKED